MNVIVAMVIGVAVAALPLAGFCREAGPHGDNPTQPPVNSPRAIKNDCAKSCAKTCEGKRGSERRDCFQSCCAACPVLPQTPPIAAMLSGTSQKNCATCQNNCKVSSDIYECLSQCNLVCFY